MAYFNILNILHIFSSVCIADFEHVLFSWVCNSYIQTSVEVPKCRNKRTHVLILT